MLHTGPCLLSVPTHGLVRASSLLLLSHIHHIGLGPSCNLGFFFKYSNNCLSQFFGSDLLVSH